MKRILILSLLCGVCVCSQAQYYLNVFKKNGTKVEYLISDLDSVTFSPYVSPVIPVNKKNISKLEMTYVENYYTGDFESSYVVSFNYDNKNRVSELSSEDGTVKLDYSNNGIILAKSERNDTLVKFLLDNSGYAKTIISKSTRVNVERNGDYISKMEAGPASGEPEPGHHYMSYGFVHDNGVLTHLIGNGTKVELPYRYNYLNPAINVDLNWFIFSGGQLEYGPMWLGYCGNINDRLFEFPSMYYTKTDSYIPLHALAQGKPGGTYHYEHKYYVLDTDLYAENNITIVNGSDGYPITITYSLNVKEYAHSFDYVVENDTIYKNKEITKGDVGEGEFYINYNASMVSGTEKDGPTGVIVGTNDIVYNFEYKQ
ncbi:MAG: hypothetical protein IKZ89_06855 [Bacteroidaceae bacterium]|nr:hypothetical protein [Bacteroidaceae bacterium]